MEEYVKSYMQYLMDVKQASKNTLSAYGTDLRQFIAYLQKEKIEEFSKVTDTRVNAYLLYLKKIGRSPATVSRNLVSIKNFMLYLIRQRVIDTDPTERIHIDKAQKSDIKTITIEQMNHLLELPNLGIRKGRRDRAMMELLYGTGMKASELIDLKVEDVNLRFGCIMVVSEGKERVLPLSKMMKDTLSLYMKDLEEEPDQKLLFVNRVGDKFTRQGVWKLVKEYAREAGIEEDFSLQIMRNSFAQHMLDNGADLKSMQELLGLSDISAAQRYQKTSKGEMFKIYQKTHPRA